MTKQAEAVAHTPGPWRHVVDIDGHPQWFRVEAVDGGICVPCYGRDPRGIDEANARLIASAPDLLAALKAYRQACVLCMDRGEDCPMCQQAGAAIAKATGGQS